MGVMVMEQWHRSNTPLLHLSTSPRMKDANPMELYSEVDRLKRVLGVLVRP